MLQAVELAPEVLVPPLGLRVQIDPRSPLRQAPSVLLRDACHDNTIVPRLSGEQGLGDRAITALTGKLPSSRSTRGNGG
jgi:hypothetical protein